MKKILFLLLTAAVHSMRASVTINLSAGDLTDQNGAAFSNGRLLFIASGPDDTFYDTVNAGQFVGGDDVIPGPTMLNHFLGGLASTSNVFTIDGDFTGQMLAIRWFPNFTSRNTKPPKLPATGSTTEFLLEQRPAPPKTGRPGFFPHLATRST